MKNRDMRRLYEFIFISLCVVLPSCQHPKDVVQKEALSAKKPVGLPTIQSFHPENKDIIVFDSTIYQTSIRVVVTGKALDSYVTQKSEGEEEVRVNNYRDFNHDVTVYRDEKIKIDTAFQKSDFKKYADTEFINSAVFKNYWFDRYDKEKGEIVFLGMITKPDTDLSFVFYHIFLLESGSYRIEEYVEEDI